MRWLVKHFAKSVIYNQSGAYKICEKQDKVLILSCKFLS